MDIGRNRKTSEGGVRKDTMASEESQTFAVFCFVKKHRLNSTETEKLLCRAKPTKKNVENNKRIEQNCGKGKNSLLSSILKPKAWHWGLRRPGEEIY